jgi:putative transposase
MRRFKSVRDAQQFLAIHTPIHNHFQLRRHRLSASEYRAARDRAFVMWREVAGLPSQANQRCIQPARWSDAKGFC